MTAVAPYKSPARPGRNGFAQALRAEWTKFRTVRGWVIGALVAVLVMAGIGLLASGGGGTGCQAAHAGASGQGSGGGGCGTSVVSPLGPGGEPVTDSFYFVRQPLAGDGTVTV